MSLVAPDGTRLAYRDVGTGEPVVCLPGGPMQAAAYLGDLGGLSAHCRLVLLDPRGTGASAVPDDPATYRCDRLVEDVEALRTHLGQERVTVPGHSAGAALAVRYAALHPDRVQRLVLVTGGLGAVGVEVSPDDRRAVARLREGEPWFAAAYAALVRVTDGVGSPDDAQALAPFFYGRWDAVDRAHHAAGLSQRNEQAAAVFAGDLAPDEDRAALTELTAPALVLAGELDVNTPPSGAASLARLLPRGELVVQPGASHYPWWDDPAAFVATAAAFLSR